MAAMPNGSSMRVASLLLCLPLAACMLTGEQPRAAKPPRQPASAVASPPAARSSGVRRRRARRRHHRRRPGDGEPVEVGPDPLTQARADCWMKVESQKGLRSIDQRSAFVDKCVAEPAEVQAQPLRIPARPRGLTRAAMAGSEPAKMHIVVSN